MWAKIIESLLGIIDKVLGLRKQRVEDPDIKNAAREATVVVTRDGHERDVQDAVKTGDLDEIRKNAGE